MSFDDAVNKCAEPTFLTVEDLPKGTATSWIAFECSDGMCWAPVDHFCLRPKRLAMRPCDRTAVEIAGGDW